MDGKEDDRSMEKNGKCMGITANLSNHHVHITDEVRRKLFGEEPLTVKRYLTKDRSMFAAWETVTVVGPKGQVENVRVVGPCRNYTQAELLRADCFNIGVEAPVRDSGDLAGAAPLKLVGPKGEVTVEECGIIAHRHIHMAGRLMEEYGLTDGQMVDVEVGGIRGLVFHNVRIRASRGEDSVMHIDQEEGNAAGFSSGEKVSVLL